MGELRIVKLEPVSNGTEAVSFEDAFGYGVGGYSYADGAGRTKRKQRKLERIANRSEVKSARQDARGTRTEGRQENRENRVAGRQSVQTQRVSGRTDLQLARKDKRLTKREMGTESRTGRRMQRADTRAYKRGLRNPADSGLDQTIPGEMGDAPVAPTSAPVDSLQGANQEQPYDNGGQSYDDGGQGYDDGGISGDQTGQGSYYGDETQYDGPEYGSENDSEDTYGSEPELDDAYEQGYQDATEDYDSEEVYVDEYEGENFDGVMGAEDRFNEMQDTNDISVNPAVQDLADKTVWNEKLIEALKFQRKNSTSNPQEISKTILVRAKRLKDLNGELVDYANACGNYSNADGSPEVLSARRREVMIARKRAQAKCVRPKQGRGYAGDVTPVNADLNPVIEKDRIVVPAESSSNASGTGINGLDLVDDFDAPVIREVYLGADGSFTKGIDLGSIAVGVLLAVGFIALNKQYKWIKL
jgi:hypothetical protein